MKFLTIVYMILIIQVSASVINWAGLYDGYSMQPYEEGYTNIGKEKIKQDQYFQSQAVQDTSISFGFGDFVKGLWDFVKTVAFGVAAVPYTFKQLGIPETLANFLSFPVYLSYLIALAQFISNRGTKGMH